MPQSNAAGHLDKLDFPKALESIWKLITRANKYIDETTPWLLAKDETKKEELKSVLYHLAEVLRIVTTLLMPFMPKLAPRVKEQLGYDFTNATWAMGETWGLLKEGTKVYKKEALFPRIDLKTLETDEEIKEEIKEAPTSSLSPLKENIEYDDFQKLDLRVALVKNCEYVEKADKLLKFTLDIGLEERTVLSGIRSFYPDPSVFIGKKVLLLANLKPRKIRGIMSEGMILSAAEDDDSLLETLLVTKDITPGSLIS